MKKLSLLKVLMILILFSGCEEVVEIDLHESERRLVVDAAILIEKDNPATSQFIKLTTTAPFFDEQVPPAQGAEVTIVSDSGNEYEFTEIEPGYYKNDNFRPGFNTTYTLIINYQNQTYTASESLVPVPDLEEIQQNNNGGLEGESIELRGYYTDPAGERNFYLFRFLEENLTLQIYDDEFTDGSRTFAYFSSDDLNRGDVVRFEIQGISRRFYEFMYLLRSQSGTSGGPFQSQPTLVRGNIINTTDPENLAFGFFRISEIDYINYTVQ